MGEDYVPGHVASVRFRTRGQPRPLVSTGSVDGYADKDERDDNH